jgi:hypothetical protein
MVDNMDEPTLPDNVNGTVAIGSAEASEGTQSQNGANDTSGTGRGAARPTLMSGLATAMREAAVRERERISGTVAEDAANHIEKVRSRAAVESEELRRLAEEDVEHIEQWSASEIERIRSEAAKKVDDRRSSLDEYLRQHDSIIDTEIEGVGQAVRDYESTLDRFFAELAELSDPSEIVRRAGLLPPSPDLDEVRATARANAMARYSEAEAGDAGASTGSTEAVAETAEPTAEATQAVSEGQASGELVGAVATESVADTAESGDGGTLSGVMDDGAGSIEPAETMEPAIETVAPAAEAEPAVAEAAVAEAAVPEAAVAEPVVAEAEQPTEPAAEPVGVMDPDAQRAPNWPAPAPEAPPAQIAPTIDNTSAAVRLLRSVAPWTAPTHAGNRGSNDSE